MDFQTDDKFKVRDRGVNINTKYLKQKYIPQELKNREEHAETIFDRLYDGTGNSNVIIRGPPGSGKTATVKYVKENVEAQNPDITTLYVNCSQKPSPQKTFTELIEQTNTSVEYQIGQSIADNIDRFFDALNKIDEHNIVVILDEADKLIRRQRNYLSRPILYNLSRPPEKFKKNLSTCVVTNNPSGIQKQIEDDVISSLQPFVIRFEKYNFDELVGILHERSKKAFENPPEKETIHRIASIVNENYRGDIRKGLMILKRFTKNLEKNEYNSVKKQIQAVSQTERQLQKNTVLDSIETKQSLDNLLIYLGLYQTYSSESKTRLKTIVKNYEEGCELAEVPKKKDSYNNRKSWVYNELEKMIEDGVLYKNAKSGYSIYRFKVDPDLFNDLITEKLERNHPKRYRKLENNLKSKETSQKAVI